MTALALVTLNASSDKSGSLSLVLPSSRLPPALNLER
jgi:hypothetical protein